MTPVKLASVMPLTKQSTAPSPQQTVQTYVEVATALPVVISCLIVAYADDAVLRLAQEPLKFDDSGNIINLQVRQAIKIVLTSEGNVDARTKEGIFGFSCSSVLYRSALRDILTELSKEGRKISLDGVFLENVSLVSLSMKNMLAVSAIFTNVNFSHSDLTGANFKGATFKSCHFDDAILDETEMLNVTFINSHFKVTLVSGMKINDSDLRNRIKMVVTRDRSGEYISTPSIDGIFSTQPGRSTKEIYRAPYLKVQF